MQNYNPKFQIDIEKRTYLNALDSVKFMDRLPRNDLSIHFWLALLRASAKATKEIVGSQLSETKQSANILASGVLTLKGKKKI
jgi:hypothetical protein